MRLVNVMYLKEGEVLARAVVNSIGKTLLQAGVKLTSTYINRLQCLGFDLVFVKDDRLDDVEIHDALSEQTRELAYKTVSSLNRYIETGKDSLLPVDKVRLTVKKMIDDLLCSYDILGNLSEIRGYDHHTFHHSVNTTTLALVLGMALKYQEPKLLELGMGVMMHDVGKIRVPEQILNKANPLTKEEFDQIKQHSTQGYEILRKHRDLSLLASHVAFQHHEKWDGSGYPRGLKGNEIHEYARVAAISDVYEALTNRRVYRAPIEPYQAYEYISAHCGTHFDPRITDVFLRHIIVYPTGSGVSLNNGQRGYVIKQNKSFPSRPYVRIFYRDEQPIEPPVEYNLAEHPSLFIVKVENRS